MTADVPLTRVLAAIIPPPRPPADDTPCGCTTCREERARQHSIDDWRNSRKVER